MKKRWKKMMAGMLAALMILGSMVPSMGKVNAASPSSNLKLWYASVKDHGVVTEFNSYTYTGGILYAMIDGCTAYCMNYAKSADGNQKMNSYTQPHTALSAEQEKLLSYCMYYGYGTTTEGTPNSTQKNQYIATQAMVWIIEKNLFGTASANSAAQKICACAPSPTEAYAFYETVRDQIWAAYYVSVPSFASTRQSSAPVHELLWNSEHERFEITLTDTTGSLANYDFALNGYSMEKNGNELTIYTNEVKTVAELAGAVAKNGVVEPTTSCVYWHIDKAKYQEFISTKPQADPVNAYLKVKTESIGYGKIIKTDVLSGAPLANASYGVYADMECTQFLERLVTGEDGSALTSPLIGGTYYVKELEAPAGYLLNETVYPMVIQPGQTVTFTFSDKEPQGLLRIFKEGEQLVGFDGTEFVYEVLPLQGAHFQITAAEDIFRCDGTKVYSKGDLVEEDVQTQADGYAEVNGLPLGVYQVVETKAPDGYVLQENSHTVNLVYVDENTPTIEIEIQCGNERQKMEITVVKKDSETKQGIEGAVFALYAGQDILSCDGTVLVEAGTVLEEARSKEDGVVLFEKDYPLGTYLVKELVPPKGYNGSTETVELKVTSQGQDKEKACYCVEFLNEKVEIPVSPLTGDKNLPILWMITGAGCIGAGIATLVKWKRKEEEQKE